MHLAAHFSSVPFPKNESDSEHLPKTLIEDKPFHVKLCRAELPIDNKKLAGLVSQGHPSSSGVFRPKMMNVRVAKHRKLHQRRELHTSDLLLRQPVNRFESLVNSCLLKRQRVLHGNRVRFPLFCVSDCSGVIFADYRVDVSYKNTPL